LIDELMGRLSKARIFTKLDIRQGFHRIRLSPESEDLTSFRTRYGSYKYRVMPLGLANGPATFQRFINETFMDYLDDFMTAFIDDLLIYSENEIEHQEHVRKVLPEATTSLRIRPTSQHKQMRVSCYPHKISRVYSYYRWYRSRSGKDCSDSCWKKLTTVRGVQSFLGFCKFYRRFIKNYSRISRPLHNLTKDNTVTQCPTPR
jgi:Reverse transcriptase (RNA-dependent DNA polymerase)